MSKLSHKRLVKIFTDMGYEEAIMYPHLDVTILYDGDSYVTVTGSKHRKGKYLPNDNVEYTDCTDCNDWTRHECCSCRGTGKVLENPELLNEK